MIALHRTNYRPIWPDAKTVRTYGEVNQRALVIFWLWWVLEIELNPVGPRY
jgi:hypothetical protein